MSGDGWNGTFTLNMQSNARHALEEVSELGGFMETTTYHEAPVAVRIAVSVAWVRAKDSVALFRGCIADFCAPWFEIEDAEPVPFCPECNSAFLYRRHADATFAAPETYCWHCERCGHEWGHE